MISSKYVYAIAREGVKIRDNFQSVARIAMKLHGVQQSAIVPSSLQ